MEQKQEAKQCQHCLKQQYHIECCLVCFLIFAAAVGADGEKSQLRCISFPSDVIRTFTVQSFRLNGGNGLTGRDKEIRPQGCALAQRAKAEPSEQTLFCQSRGIFENCDMHYQFAYFFGNVKPPTQRASRCCCCHHHALTVSCSDVHALGMQCRDAGAARGLRALPGSVKEFVALRSRITLPQISSQSRLCSVAVGLQLGPRP